MRTAAGRTGRVFALARVLAGVFRGGRGGPAEQLRAAGRMIRAALTGRYPGVSKGTLALLALGAVYIVSPVDLAPEALLAMVGLVDDVGVAVWLASTLAMETEKFQAWELGRPAAGGRVVPGEVLREDAARPPRG